MPQRTLKTSGQQAAEASVEAFRSDLGPFVVAAETTRMPMVFTDAQGPGNPIIFANQSFLMLTGYGEHEVLAQSFDFLFAQGTDPEALVELRTAFRGGRGLEPHIQCRRKDGTLIWVEVYVSPVRDADGVVVQHFASFIDITRHKAERDRLSALLDARDHRTQDTLATMLATALHGVAATAAQHGALASDGGRITVEWALEPGPGGATLRLRWQESGDPAAPPAFQGLWSRLLRQGLAQDLGRGVRLECAADGLSGEIVVPLP